ncbi:hypothetical protein GGF46_003439 [Coemansia sp. RSA 552]|nr:hypothetical protein GGF46_003439 [Coemansia sp. RSA 552]
MSKAFFNSQRFVVVGASADPAKYGNKVLRWYISQNLPVTPLNPKAGKIEGIPCIKSLDELPESNSPEAMGRVGVSVVTPPKVSEGVLEAAARLGIKQLWFQPGSEPDKLTEVAKGLGVSAVGGGPCILVLGKRLLDQARL